MRKRPLLAITIIVAVSLFLLDRLGALSFLTSPLVTLVKPWQAGTLIIERRISSVWSVVGRIAQLNGENRALERENALLKAENAHFATVQAENKLLRDQLYLHRFERNLVRAETYGFDPETHELLIHTDETVTDGSMVVVGDNYIGKITHHNGYFAKVQVPTDPNAQIPIVTSGGVRGLTRGHYRSEVVIDKVVVEDKAAIHDIVRTSGEGGYVKDLVVGEVTQVTSSEKALFKQVVVTPLLDVGQLDTLFIIQNQ